MMWPFSAQKGLHMALVEDDASMYLDQLPPDQQKYRYRPNGLPRIREDAVPEESRVRDTCLDSLRSVR